MAEEINDEFSLARDLTFRDSDAQVMPDQRYPEDKVPKLGHSRYPGRIGTYSVATIQINAGQPDRITVAKPTLLIPFTQFLATPGATFYDISYAPDNWQTTFAGITIASIISQRGVIYLWAPGPWRIAVVTDGTLGSPFPYFRIPIEDPLVVDRLCKTEWNGRDREAGGNQVVVPAAVLTTVFDVDSIMQMEYLRISSTAACRLAFGTITPSATVGTPIAAGGSIEYFGLKFPTAQLRAFSAAGTTLDIEIVNRSFSQADV